MPQPLVELAQRPPDVPELPPGGLSQAAFVIGVLGVLFNVVSYAEVFI